MVLVELITCTTSLCCCNITGDYCTIQQSLCVYNVCCVCVSKGDGRVGREKERGGGEKREGRRGRGQ